MAKLDYPEISKLLKYEPETGKLFWLPRSVEMFQGGNTSQEAVAKNWNSRYADKEAFTAMSDGYYVGRLSGRTFKSHRVAWLLHYGRWPSNHIDHINGVRSDNRIANLRDVEPLGNSRNMKRYSRNKSGICGVSLESRTGKWVVHLSVKGRGIYIGRFDSIELAAKAREEANAKYGFSEDHGRVQI